MLIIPIDTTLKRLACGIVVLATLVWAAFAVVWGFANAAASQAEFIEVADQALAISPGDPQTHYAAAVLLDRSFEAGDFDRALTHYERAAELAPNDHWLWLELGRAYERRGDPAKAVAAMRYALALAPNYSAIQWTLGNTLLRQGNTDEAFALIRSASAGDAKYTENAALLAWQMNAGNIDDVRRAVGDSVRLNAALAVLLANEKRFDEAAVVWAAIPEAEKTGPVLDSGNRLLSQMLEARRFRPAAGIAAELGKASANSFAVGNIFNGGFEQAVRPSGAQAFDWQLDNGQHPQIALTNGEKRTGNNSLVMIFNPSDRTGAARGMTQLVAVRPGGRYTLSYQYKADLETATTFRWAIKSAADGSPIASGEPFKAKTDWTSAGFGFTVPENTDGVYVSFTRDACNSGRCTVGGSLWLDDISLAGQ